MIIIELFFIHVTLSYLYKYAYVCKNKSWYLVSICIIFNIYFLYKVVCKLELVYLYYKILHKLILHDHKIVK